MATVVLGVTGCIGAYKACEVLRELQRHDVEVRVVMTQNAARFVAPLTFQALSHHPVFVDGFAPGEQGDIQHIGLADQAGLLLVAPATANASVIAIIPILEVQNAKVALAPSKSLRPVSCGIAYAMMASTSIA